MTVFRASAPLVLIFVGLGTMASAQTAVPFRLSGFVLSAVDLEVTQQGRVIPVEDSLHAESMVAMIINRTNSLIGFTVFLTSAHGGRLSDGQTADLGYQLSYNGQPVRLGSGAAQVNQVPGSNQPKVVRHVLKMRMTEMPFSKSPRKGAYSDTLTLSIVSL